MRHGVALVHVGQSRTKMFWLRLIPSNVRLREKNLRRKDIPLKNGDFRKLSESWKERFDRQVDRRPRPVARQLHDVIHYNAMRKPGLESYFAGTQFKKVDDFGKHRFPPYSVGKSGRLIFVVQK